MPKPKKMKIEIALSLQDLYLLSRAVVQGAEKASKTFKAQELEDLQELAACLQSIVADPYPGTTYNLSFGPSEW